MTLVDPMTIGLPDWVPAHAKVYLAHTEAGHTIRSLAREKGCHASTIMRQIRRIEGQRDDPLIDSVLQELGHHVADRADLGPQALETKSMTINRTDMPLSDAALKAEGARILRRLCETGAVLAVAAEMEKAVVVRDGVDGSSTRTAVVDRNVAQAMALKGWIAATIAGKITRYHITAAGRTALTELLALSENAKAAQVGSGMAEAPASFTARDDTDWSTPEDPGQVRRLRHALAESPLTALARRRDKDGTTFLSAELVAAGERLREDFELAQMGPRVSQNWDSFLTGGARETYAPDRNIPRGPGQARDRVAAALSDLGPGLSDVALRCCCFLEGLEAAEKRLGWSARSAKIVLRIALHRLKRHYEEVSAGGGGMIG